jgi:hypothetical protein
VSADVAGMALRTALFFIGYRDYSRVFSILSRVLVFASPTHLRVSMPSARNAETVAAVRSLQEPRVAAELPADAADVGPDVIRRMRALRGSGDVRKGGHG